MEAGVTVMTTVHQGTSNGSTSRRVLVIRGAPPDLAICETAPARQIVSGWRARMRRD